MNSNNILDSENTLQVLKTIEKNSYITQRDLSRELGISLGKINFLINSLIDKGIIKAKNFKNSKNKLAYMYLITPHGIKEKTQLTQSFLARKLEEYEKLKQEIMMLKKETVVSCE